MTKLKTTYTKTTITEEPRLTIRHDEFSISPRKWSNLGYFLTKDRNYYSPDAVLAPKIQAIMEETGEEAENQKDHIAAMTRRINKETDEKVKAIYPIVKYEHGGVSYSLGTIHGFDYSNNGFYIITDKSQKELGTDAEDFKTVIKGELEAYNQYANGEVYAFVLYDENGNVVDSCGGFYSLEDIKEELPEEWRGENMADYLIN